MTHTQAVDGPRLLLAALCRGKATLSVTANPDSQNPAIVVSLPGFGSYLGSHFVLALAADGTPILGEALTQTLVKLMEEHANP